mmetsp:Transcript_101328/g.284053  ORF Transcript_101328/g.284053 Transcript_101328/m.284053 type:complete len:370 (-) Transcript_101328:8-1117(-)
MHPSHVPQEDDPIGNQASRQREREAVAEPSDPCHPKRHEVVAGEDSVRQAPRQGGHAAGGRAEGDAQEEAVGDALHLGDVALHAGLRLGVVCRARLLLRVAGGLAISRPLLQGVHEAYDEGGDHQSNCDGVDEHGHHPTARHYHQEQIPRLQAATRQQRLESEAFREADLLEGDVDQVDRDKQHLDAVPIRLCDLVCAGDLARGNEDDRQQAGGIDRKHLEDPEAAAQQGDAHHCIRLVVLSVNWPGETEHHEDGDADDGSEQLLRLPESAAEGSIGFDVVRHRHRRGMAQVPRIRGKRTRALQADVARRPVQQRPLPRGGLRARGHDRRLRHGGAGRRRGRRRHGCARALCSGSGSAAHHRGDGARGA